MNMERVLQTLKTLNEFGVSEDGISRLAYSCEEEKAKYYLIEQCTALGMKTRIDPAGNVISRLEGEDDSLPAVAIGSHLDTVYNGGKYDGTLGVVCGLEVIRAFMEEGIKTRHSIELIAFACEESARFNVSTIGSKAMIGDIKKDIFRIKDREGITLKEALKRQNLDEKELEKANRIQSELKSFFELHIEQGMKLIENKKNIGLVTGIAAPLRMGLKITGKSSHSGTTGMKERQDALLAASELSLLIEAAALKESEYETVGTVGTMEVYPGAINVIPGLVKLKVDIRSSNISSRNRVVQALQKGISQMKDNRGVSVQIEWMMEESPVLMDKELLKNNVLICERLGLDYMFLSSGAGHDSMNMSKRWPTSLIFVPSVQGLSHHPDEFTELNDIEKGLSLLMEMTKEQAIVLMKGEKQHGNKSS
ncbi:Zn-dependent hydrolase [Robertmurraya massiliosenegalensis]|uniref:Zn-dependent hydrolase n=1 Tax=Robertmurraya massiliosenegalensis TaxID=1287657 RepID=UPI0002DAC95B|nr:Zn-dependent hydrolase [Robertmurraya massiliosenegalensis]